MHLACHTGTSTATYDVTLEKNARSREDEEAVCGLAVLSVAAYHSGVAADNIPAWPSLPSLTPEDTLEQGTTDLRDPVQALLDGRVRCVEFSGPVGDRRVVVDAPRSGALILPGSFNPLHDGHKCVLALGHDRLHQDYMACHVLVMVVGLRWQSLLDRQLCGGVEDGWGMIRVHQ